MSCLDDRLVVSLNQQVTVATGTRIVGVPQDIADRLPGEPFPAIRPDAVAVENPRDLAQR